LKADPLSPTTNPSSNYMRPATVAQLLFALLQLNFSIQGRQEIDKDLSGETSGAGAVAGKQRPEHSGSGDGHFVEVVANELFKFIQPRKSGRVARKSGKKGDRG
jgi:hypothetical protein